MHDASVLNEDNSLVCGMLLTMCSTLVIDLIFKARKAALEYILVVYTSPSLTYWALGIGMSIPHRE